jgi:hypothetical protein
LTYLKYASKEILFICLITIFNENILCLLGLDLKFEVGVGITWGHLSYIDGKKKHAKLAVSFRLKT